MRRKLFIFTMALVAVIYVADCFDIPLRKDKLSQFEGQFNDYTGKIISVEEKDYKYYKVEIRINTVGGKKFRSNENVLLNYYGIIEKPYDMLYRNISFVASFAKAQETRNPHCFNYRKYLKSEGIGMTGTLGAFEIQNSEVTAANLRTRRKYEFSLPERFERFILKKKYEFERMVPEEVRSITLGVLFGDTDDLDEETYDSFRRNGTAHILAVSGLHVGILYGIYDRLQRKRKSRMLDLVFFFMLFTYGTLALWSTSIKRATIMIIASRIGKEFDLRYDSLTGLSFAALIIIMANPYAIFGVSFQMSFLAIMSIKFFEKVMPRNMPEVLVPTVSVTIGLGLYQAYVFNYFSFISVFVNIPIVYLAGYIVPCAIAAFMLFLMASGIGPFEMLLTGLGKLIVFINEFASLRGKSAIDLASWNAGIVALIMFTLFFSVSETRYILNKRNNKEIIFKIYTCAVIFCLFIAKTTFSPITHDDIIFCDVGQGDCIHVRYGETNILIDGGGSANYNTGKNTLKPYLLKNGVTDIDLAFVTHMHTDHFKGIEELSECFRIKKMVTESVAGEKYSVNDLSIETLWPLSIDEGGQEENSNCSVFLIRYGKYKIMVTGDLDEKGEKELISYYRGKGMENILKCDILKVGHHGSKTSTSEEFIQTVRPAIAVVQVGKNSFGHPTEEVLERLKNYGISVYRNDICGAIGFRLKSDKISVHTVIR